MANRITESQLNTTLLRLNKLTNNPLTYASDVDGKRVINVGNYHLDSAYGGTQVVQTSNTSGGVRNVFNSGFTTKRAVYDLLQAYIAGIETANK